MAIDFLYALEKNYLSPKECQLPTQTLFSMARNFEEPMETFEGNWFKVIKVANKYQRKFPKDKRIKIDKNDSIFSIYDKWRELWDAADNKEKDFYHQSP
jgi:hypothetical protein